MTWRDLRGSASLWLAAVSVVVMGLFWLFPAAHDEWIVRGGFIPIRLEIDVETPLALLPAWLTPLSASFIHGDSWHLLMNMLVLLWCGRFVEEVIGRARMVLLYIVGAYASALAEYVWDPISIVPMVGASGAIGAVFGAFALIYGRPKQVTGNPKADRAIHAVWLLAFWVIIQWMVSVLDDGFGYSVATVAHVGGFLAGLVMLPLLRPRPRPDVA